MAAESGASGEVLEEELWEIEVGLFKFEGESAYLDHCRLRH